MLSLNVYKNLLFLVFRLLNFFYLFALQIVNYSKRLPVPFRHRAIRLNVFHGLLFNSKAG